MADFLVQALLSSLLFGIAWLVQRYARLPSLANLPWALVLIKLVTPPLKPEKMSVEGAKRSFGT